MNTAQIKQLRRSLSLTQEEFARKVGVAYFTVVRWENDMNKPSRLAMEKLEQIAQKELGFLVDLTPKPGKFDTATPAEKRLSKSTDETS